MDLNVYLISVPELCHFYPDFRIIFMIFFLRAATTRQLNPGEEHGVAATHQRGQPPRRRNAPQAAIIDVDASDDNEWEPTNPTFLEPVPVPEPDVQNMFNDYFFADRVADDSGEQRTCIICLENIPRFLLRPCGHLCFCYLCNAKEDVLNAFRSERNKDYKPLCYLCRKEIKGKVMVEY